VIFFILLWNYFQIFRRGRQCIQHMVSATVLLNTFGQILRFLLIDFLLKRECLFGRLFVLFFNHLFFLVLKRSYFVLLFPTFLRFWKDRCVKGWLWLFRCCFVIEGRTLRLLSCNGKNLLEEVFFVDCSHFNVVLLLYLWSCDAPVYFQFDSDILRYIFYNFNRDGQAGERLKKAIARIHGDVVFLVGFDLSKIKNTL